MSSLHDLIYSQASNTEEAQEHEETTTEKNALKASFKQEEDLEPPQDKKKRKRSRQNDSRIQNEETESQAEERQFKERQHRKWQRLRWRWKNKKYDLSSEVDYGGVVQYVADKVVQPEESDLEQQQQEQVLTYDVDSSDEEHLGSLLSPPAVAVRPDEIPSHLLDFDNLDYWSKGYMIPPGRPTFSYGSSAPQEQAGEGVPAVILNAAAAEEAEPMDDECPHPEIRASLMKELPTKSCDPFYCFPLRHATKCPAHGGFFHHRNMVRMAARCTMLSHPSPQDCELQDRLIKALHQKSQRQAHRIRLLKHQARERAADFEFFHQHKWKSKSLAMRELGVGPILEHTGSPHWINASLKLDAVKDRRRNNRIRLIKFLSLKDDNDKANGSCQQNTLDDATAAAENPTASLVQSAGGYDFMNDNTHAQEGVNTECICIPATNDYSHVPGTSPPVPNFPLDENNFLFGATDENAWTHHHSNVDPTVYSLTTAVLLSRFAVARNRKVGIKKAQDNMEAYLNRTMQSISPDHTKLVWMVHHDLPDVPLYMAVMGYCSYFANCGGSLDHEMVNTMFSTPENPDKLMTENGSEEEDVGDKTEVSTANIQARLMYDQCEGFISDRRLASFPMVHLTIGISRIVMSLPPTAAEIVCRSCSSESERTPFELVRSALELMEHKELLVDTHIMFSEGDAVNVGELEHNLYLASDLFIRCLEADNTEVAHHEWYITALAGSLLLCSGNAIGGGARCRPSSKVESSGYQMLLSRNSSTGASFTLEKRQKMEKFEEVRKQLADAVLALVGLSKQPQNKKSSRAHLALSSLLEWSEVVALIVGPPRRKAKPESSMRSSCRQVRRLHAYHAVHWAIRENSTRCFRRLNDLLRSKEVTVDAPAAVAAGILENNPADRRNWQRLLGVLGDVGRPKESGQIMCRRTKCAACKRLRKGLYFDHEDLRTRKETCGWWGEGRRWWDAELLRPHKWIFTPDRATPDTIFRVSAEIEKRLRNCSALSSSFCDDGDEILELKSPAVGVASEQALDINWLRIYTHANDESDSDTESINGVPVQQTSGRIEENMDVSTYDADLPKASSRLSGFALEAPSHRRVHDLVLSNSQGCGELENLLYKVLVTCHLSGVVHPSITNCIWHLARESCMLFESGKSEGDCDEWKGLVWLSLRGLDIPQILHDTYMSRLNNEKLESPIRT